MTAIYLDYMSTTPTDPRVIEAMQDCLSTHYANPSSSHSLGHKARCLLDHAACEVSALLNGDPQGVLWTSGATESINLALKGVTEQYQRHGRHIITSAIEHEAVLATTRFLEKQGFEVTYLPVNATGCFEIDALKDALRDDTILVSLMHANNESGVIQPITEIGHLLQQHQSLFHVDAAQSLGKIPVDVHAMSIDLLSASAHKFYGPKGIGCLYVRQSPKLRLSPQIHGGSQQHRLRAGTLPTHQIVGFAKAAELARLHLANEAESLLMKRQRLWDDLQVIDGVTMIGDSQARLPGHLAFYCEGVSSELMMKAMPDLCVSQHSACRYEQAMPSHVHQAMGLSSAQSLSSLRLAIGRMTDDMMLEKASYILTKTLKALKE